MSSDSYVEEVIRNLMKCMKNYNMELNKSLSDVNYSSNNPFYDVE